MGGCDGVGAVKGVLEGGVEGAEREFVDYVGEVECWKCERERKRGGFVLAEGKVYIWKKYGEGRRGKKRGGKKIRKKEKRGGGMGKVEAEMMMMMISSKGKKEERGEEGFLELT